MGLNHEQNPYFVNLSQTCSTSAKSFSSRDIFLKDSNFKLIDNRGTEFSFDFTQNTNILSISVNKHHVVELQPSQLEWSEFTDNGTKYLSLHWNNQQHLFPRYKNTGQRRNQWPADQWKIFFSQKFNNDIAHLRNNQKQSE